MSENLATALEEAQERYHREYDEPLQAMARQRGELANRQNTIRARLREISPSVGADGLITDPSDSDLALRGERAAIRAEIHRIESSIREIDAKRGALEVRAAGERERLEQLDYHCDETKQFETLAGLAMDCAAVIDSITEARTLIEKHQQKYPQHRHLPKNVTLRAHAGAPPLVALLSTVSSALKLLLDQLAEWNVEILPSDHPSRTRAEAIARADSKLAEATVQAQRREAEATRERAAQRGVAVAPPAPPRPMVDLLDCYERVESERAATK